MPLPVRVRHPAFRTAFAPLSVAAALAAVSLACGGSERVVRLPVPEAEEVADGNRPARRSSSSAPA